MPKRLTVSLPDPVYEHFARIAESSGCPVAELFRHWAISEFRSVSAPRQQQDPNSRRSQQAINAAESKVRRHARDDRLLNQYVNAEGREWVGMTWDTALRLSYDDRVNIEDDMSVIGTSDRDREAHDAMLDSVLTRAFKRCIEKGRPPGVIHLTRETTNYYGRPGNAIGAVCKKLGLTYDPADADPPEVDDGPDE